MYELVAAIAASLAILTQPFAYEFMCGYEIDGILIHEGIPKHNGTWWGYAVPNMIVIRYGLEPDEKMMVFAHERFHTGRMKDGIFDYNNKYHEEELAYLYGWNESNWDTRILRHRCVVE